MPAPPQATIGLLHKFLGIGLVVLGSVFVFLKVRGIVPFLHVEQASALIAYTFSGLVVLVIVATWLFVKPRVPERRIGQPVDEYLGTPATLQRILLVIFLIEGAAMFATVGFALTGTTVAGVTMALAIAVFWLTGPDAFAKP